MEQKTQNIIKEIINKIPLQTDEISFSSEDDDQVLWCHIRTKEPSLFIGREGEALAALNNIVRKIVDKSFFDGNQGLDPSLGVRPLSQKIVIDVNGFQKNKIENLKTTAHMLSERAQFFKSSIETDPLSAVDRKTIHEFLADRKNIQTESIGIDPFRRVIIKYIE